MADITYCVSQCPFDDCFRHSNKLKELYDQGQKYVSIADFAPTCRRYIDYVLEVVENG